MKRHIIALLLCLLPATTYAWDDNNEPTRRFRSDTESPREYLRRQEEREQRALQLMEEQAERERKAEARAQANELSESLSRSLERDKNDPSLYPFGRGSIERLP